MERRSLIGFKVHSFLKFIEIEGFKETMPISFLPEYLIANALLVVVFV